MAGGCINICILIQVLLITTAYGGQTQISINCPNQYWIEGKPLTVTCNVTCYANNGCSSDTYKWKNTDDTDLGCKENNRAITEGKSHIFNCTIENPTWKQNTTLKFWVQMTTGPQDTTFNVNIESSKIRPADPTESTNGNSESRTSESGRSNTVAVAVIVILCLATVVGVLLIKYNASILALCSRKTITEADIL